MKALQSPDVIGQIATARQIIVNLILENDLLDTSIPSQFEQKFRNELRINELEDLIVELKRQDAGVTPTAEPVDPFRPIITKKHLSLIWSTGE